MVINKKKQLNSCIGNKHRNKRIKNVYNFDKIKKHSYFNNLKYTYGF